MSKSVRCIEALFAGWLPLTRNATLPCMEVVSMARMVLTASTDKRDPVRTLCHSH